MPETVFTTPCACWHVRRASRVLSQIYDTHLRPVGIRSSQFGMLRCIEAAPNLCISHMARLLGMDQTTVTRNIETLERNGLVHTVYDTIDPRKKLVRLSDQGEKAVLKALPLWEEAQGQVMARMGAEKYRAFLESMEGISALAQE